MTKQWSTYNFSALVEKRSALLLIPIYSIAICLALIFQKFFFAINDIPCNAISDAPANLILTLHSTPAELMQCFGGSDLGSYIRGAFALQEHGLAAFTSIGYGTWPPGFSFLELAIIRLNIVPLPMALLLITVLLWAVIFHHLYALLRQTAEIGVLCAVALPLLLLILPFFYNLALYPYLFFSEPISSAIFLIALLDVWRRVASGQSISIARAIYIGFLLAICTYLRAQYDFISYALFGMAFLIMGVSWIYSKKNNGSDTPYRKMLLKLAISTFIMFLVFQSCVLVYKIHRYVVANTPTMASVTYIFETVWTPESITRARGGSFFSNGGGNSICEFEPVKCQAFEDRRKLGEKISINEYMQAALSVVINRPIDFLIYKWPYFWEAWGNVWGGWEKDDYKFEIGAGQIVFNYSFFVILCLLGIYRISMDRNRGLIEFAFLTAILIGSTFFSWIVHFESRYLLPVRLIGFVWVLVVVTESVKMRVGRNVKACK